MINVDVSNYNPNTEFEKVMFIGMTLAKLGIEVKSGFKIYMVAPSNMHQVRVAFTKQVNFRVAESYERETRIDYSVIDIQLHRVEEYALFVGYCDQINTLYIQECI